MQAILTKYFGPTNTRGSKIKAFCDAGSITIPYPHELSGEDVHRKAAEALRDKLGWNDEWYGNMVAGGCPQGFKGADYVFVFVTKS